MNNETDSQVEATQSSTEEASNSVANVPTAPGSEASVSASDTGESSSVANGSEESSDSKKTTLLNQGSDSFAYVLQEPPQPVTVKALIKAGAHFGHQVDRWNPKMLPFIYGERSGVHIVNLDATVAAWKRARSAIVTTVANGGTVLMVGTKLQARESIRKEAERCGAHSITTRWLGGTLTNFRTIRRSLEKMKKIEDLLEKAEQPDSGFRLVKKEKISLGRKLDRLQSEIGGIREMRRVPDLLFIVDIGKEHIAVAEAAKLGIPAVGLVDTNADPEKVEFPVPCNDDAARTIRLFAGAVAEAVLEGQEMMKAVRAAQAKDAPKREGVNRPKVEYAESTGASA